MNKQLLTIIATIATCLISSLAAKAQDNEQIQTKVATSELADLYKSTRSNQISVHDPSVVYNDKDGYFYIFGSHYYGGKSKDLRNWTAITNYYNTTYDAAFKSNARRTIKRVLPGKATPETLVTDESVIEEVSFPSFDASAFCATYAGIQVGDRQPTTEANWLRGDQWAPDVVWNPTMNKWCYYVSLNGDNWASVVVLMTSDSPAGPYKYQGPVVFSGFNGQTYSGKSVDYKKTDLEIVLGTQSSLPTRYKTNQWGTYYPNCIDPCAFIDEEGELWLAYGSWSGGIWMLKLDKQTGLRDYTYTYKGTGTSPNATSDDAYFGKRIAGGYYVSGEGPYIQHIGKYYYLFMSYGGFAPDGGYEMRVFRSDKPTGPYKDASGNAATFTRYELNYGPRAVTNRGMKLIGAMNNWGLMTVGECAQGHNSACVDDQGRSFLVCHTKFNNGTLGHSVRAYQMYLNKYGWLVTAPFQFAGETTTDADIATTQPFSPADLEGDYQFLLHPYKLDHANMAEATPITIRLTADGRIKGGKTGTWKYTDEGASYIQLVIDNVTYNGVVTEQTLENNTAKTICFTAVCNTSGNSSCGVPVWGYKLHPKSAIALNYQQNSNNFKLSSLISISKNMPIMFDPTDNVTLTWTSSRPDLFSETGKYNPDTIDTPISLTARLESGSYYWENNYNSTVKATNILGDPYSGIVAYYDFNASPNYNAYNDAQKATLGRSNLTNGTSPKYLSDYARFGKYLHTSFGAMSNNSYSRFDNPLLNAANLEGFTVSVWVNRSDANLWDALWSFFDSTTPSAEGPRLFVTGNCYLGFNDNAGNWFDINHPDKKKIEKLTVGDWKLLTITFSATNGYTIYIDGTKNLSNSFAGSASTITAFDKQKVLDVVKSSKYFYFGLGSFWGSAEASYDDLLIYNRELSADDVKGLNAVLNRVNDLTPEGVQIVTAIENTLADHNSPAHTLNGTFDLQGRRVLNPTKGLYIINGKKTWVK